MMKWLPRVFGRGAPQPPERKSAVSAPISATLVGALDDFYSYGGPGAIIPPFLCWRLYKSVATLAKVVDLIADQTARIAPIVTVDGEPDPTHPLNLLLAKPGYGRSRRALIKELAVQQLISGTGYLHAIGLVDRPPQALDVIKSHFVSPVQGSDMWPARLIYAEGSRHTNFERDASSWLDMRFTDGRLNETVPIIDVSGDIRGIGLSRLQAVRADLDLRLRGIEHNANMLANGASPGYAAVWKENLSPDQAEDVREQLRVELAGTRNAGRIAVLSGGEMDLKPLSLSARDMDFSNLARLTDDSIVARYNVPITLFNVQAQTNNNYATAWEMLYDNAVLPLFDVVYGGIARLASNRYGQEIAIEHDPLSNSILAAKAAARAKELYSANLITRNEGRKIIGYEPTIGGDVFFQSMGMVPSGYDYFTDHGTPSADVANALGLEPGTGDEAEVREPGPNGSSDDIAPPSVKPKPKPLRQAAEPQKPGTTDAPGRSTAASVH